MGTRVTKKLPRTMEEFAVACGVSRPTLSKFFENPDSVKGSTRQRIEAKLEETGYRPNLYARNLNRKRTRTVGIVVPSINDPFYAGLVTRLEILLRAQGYWPLTISPHGQPELEGEALLTLQSLKVGGALIAPLGFASDLGAMARFAEGTPCVFLDNAIGTLGPFVGTDNAQSVGTMVDYLCRSGSAPIYLNTPAVNRGVNERRAAYESAVARHGATPVVLDSDMGHPWDLEQVGHDRMRACIADGLPGTTILCANDRLAFGVIAAAHEAGLRVGHGAGFDLRVAGHDDHPLSRFSAPSLTTMAQDYDAICHKAGDLLLAALEGGRLDYADSTRLPAKLVMRGSA